MRYFIFECKKLLFTKRFLIALAIIIGAISLLFFRNLTFQDYAREQVIKEHSRIVKFHRDKDYALYNHLTENDGDQNALEQKERNEPILQKALIWSTSYTGGEPWQEVLHKENEYLLSLDPQIELEEAIPLSLEEIKNSLILNDELLKREIPPEFENYSIATPNFLKQVVDFFVMYGSIVIILILLSDLLAGEFENRTILFQFTQPINRANIIFSKFAAALIMYAIVLLSIILTAYALPTFLGEKGDFNYPVFIEQAGELQAIAISDYLLYAGLANFVLALLIISLYLLFSVLTKHILLTLFTVAGISISAALLASIFKGKLIALLNPFRFLLSMNFISMQTNQNWYDGLIASGLLTITFLFIASQLIKKSKVE